MKVTYTEEAVADIVEAITYLTERNPTAAANLEAEIDSASSAWLRRNSMAPSPGCDPVLLCKVGPSRHSASTISVTRFKPTLVTSGL